MPTVSVAYEVSPRRRKSASEVGRGYKSYDAITPEGDNRKVQYYVQRHGYEMLGYPVPMRDGIWSVGVQFPDGSKAVITVPNREVERVWVARASGAHETGAAAESPTRDEWEVTVRRTGRVDKIVEAAGRKPDEIVGQNIVFGEFYDDEKAQAFAHKMMRAGYLSMFGPRPKPVATEIRAESGDWLVVHPPTDIIALPGGWTVTLERDGRRRRWRARSENDRGDVVLTQVHADRRGALDQAKAHIGPRRKVEAAATEASRYGRRRWSEPDPSIEVDTKRRAAYSAKVTALTSGLTKVSGEDLIHKYKVRTPETGRETVAVLSDAKTNEPRAILWKWDGWGYGESGGVSMVYWLLPGVLPVSGGAEESAPCNRLERGGVTGDCSALAKEIGPIETDKDLYRLFAPRMRKEPQEVFYVACVDVHGMLCGFTEIARGQVSRVSVDVEDVIQCVLSFKPRPTAFCVGHVHPGGKARPSEADKKLTDDIRSSARVAMPNVVFMDHIIIGGGESNREYFSFTDNRVKRA